MWLRAQLSFSSSYKMVDKVIFIALFALIGASFIQAASVGSPMPQRVIIDRLNCSALTGDSIIIRNSEYLAVEDPCNIKAKKIYLENNKFPSSPQAFNITGTDVWMKANVFSGKRQDNYIFGQNLLIENNTFEGELQIFEVTGINVHLENNTYRSNLLLYQVTGLKTFMEHINVFTNNLIMPHVNGIDEISKKHFMKLFNINNIIEDHIVFVQIEKHSRYYEVPPNYPISLQDRAKFEHEVLTSSKINRVGSPVLSSFIELILKSDRSYLNSS